MIIHFTDKWKSTKMAVIRVDESPCDKDSCDARGSHFKYYTESCAWSGFTSQITVSGWLSG